MNTTLVITGVGVVSAAGTGIEAFHRVMSTEGSGGGFGPPTIFPGGTYPDARVAEVPDFDAAVVMGDKGLRNMDRLTRLFLVADRLALRHAGIKNQDAFVSLGPSSVGVCAATAYGSLEAITELDRVARLEDPRYLNPGRFPNTVINAALGYVSIREDLRALNVTVTNGIPGPIDAVFCAGTYLLAGRAKAIVVGGAEALSEALYVACTRMNLLAPSTVSWNPSVSTPSGTRLGEGAAMMVLETLSGSLDRGATPLATVAGYGTAFEPPPRAGQITAPSAEALGRAIRGALAAAGIPARAVDLVVSGRNGVDALDRAEAMALGDTLPGVALAVPKRALGETFGAGGALAMAAAVGWLGNNRVGPILGDNLPARVHTVLVPALGYYGNASALVLRRLEQTTLS